MNEEDKLRQERLKVFFRDSPDWKDLKLELEQIYNNADFVVHNTTSPNEKREIYIGKCAAIKEVMGLEDGFARIQ